MPMRAYIDVLKKLDHLEKLKPFGGKEYTGYESKSNEMKSPEGFRHIVKGTFGRECEPRERQRTCGVSIPGRQGRDVLRRKTYHIPHNTRVEKRR